VIDPARYGSRLAPRTARAPVTSGPRSRPAAPTSATRKRKSQAGIWQPDQPGWRTGYGASNWQTLSALQAVPGVTALAGQVLTLVGTPLRDVTLKDTAARLAPLAMADALAMLDELRMAPALRGARTTR
jgi:hypothetical protein